MINSKKQMFIVIEVFAALLMLTTVTYAFFNYTRTSIANTIQVGRIYFNTMQTDTINLTNFVPISSEDALTDTTNVGTTTIRITGDTEYNSGIEYLVKTVDVHNTIIIGSTEKVIPISIIVSYEESSGETIGEEDNSYFINRGGNSSIYKVISGKTIIDNGNLSVGYIAPEQTGIDGVITIKAYVDEDNIIVSNYDVLETDKVVLTMEEWNSLKGNNALSFKIMVEANEGIWVENPDLLVNRVKAMSMGILDNSEGNTIFTNSIIDYYTYEFSNNSSTKNMSNNSSEYFTYGNCNDISIDSSGYYSIANARATRYSVLTNETNLRVFKNKCIASIYGSSSSDPDATRLYDVYKVGPNTTASSLEYFPATKSPHYLEQQTGVLELGSTVNDTNPIYFFRGDKSVNNNVIFDNKCWLIVRTTELNGTRIIYNGTPIDGKCGMNLSFVSNEPRVQFNNYANNLIYAGYTYQVDNEEIDSNLKTYLDGWYSNNIANINKSYIEQSTYCNDRTLLTEEQKSEVGFTSGAHFAPAYRIAKGTPTVSCPNEYSYKLNIGFLTVDDAMLAGGSYQSNIKTYLSDDYYSFWTGSPYRFDSNQEIHIFSIMVILKGYADADDDTARPRPVISIKSDTIVLSGDGSQDNPFLIGE